MVWQGCLEGDCERASLPMDSRVWLSQSFGRPLKNNLTGDWTPNSHVPCRRWQIEISPKWSHADRQLATTLMNFWKCSYAFYRRLFFLISKTTGTLAESQGYLCFSGGYHKASNWRAVATMIHLSRMFSFEGVFDCLKPLRELLYCRGCCQRGLVAEIRVMVGFVSPESLL